MPSSKLRLLQAYSRIADENLRDLVAQLVQIYSENASDRTPRARYKAVIDTFANHFGNELDTTYLEQSDMQGQAAAPRGDRRSEGVITLQSLTLCNFGSYRGEVTFDFSPHSDRNVTIVVGSNGDGKSTLFYGLNWALYGDDYLSELEADKGRTLESLVNRGALEDAAGSGVGVTTSVRLSFRIRGVDYYVTREATAEPTSGGSVRLTQQRMSLRKIDASGNHSDLLPGALTLLLSGLPKHVRDFYLFDGEQINRFVAPGAQVHIRRAIRRVMGIDALEQTAEGLARVASDYRREVAANSTGELEVVTKRLEGAHTQLTEARKIVDTKREEISLITSAVAELDKLLANAPDTRPHHARRLQLEKQLQNSREDQERLSYEIRELSADASLILAGDAVSQLIQDLDKKRQAGVIPGPINRQLLKDLLDIGTCICGSDISEGTHTREHIESTLDELRKKADTGQASLELFYELSGLDGRLKERALALDKKRMELDRLFERRRIDREQLDEVEATLAGMVEVDRVGWERERSQKRDLERKAIADKAMAEARISDLNVRIKKLEEEESKITIGNERAIELKKRRDWAEAAESALRRVYEEFATVARDDVESSTAELWKHLLPNIERYKVVVSEDFELQVLDPVGRPAMQDLSMGQQQCLGLAFITAVAQVAESRPPLVIDMPFGRLGVEVASSVASTLPTLTEQLILFVLPETEWNDETKSAIEPFIAREYVITYDAAAQATEQRLTGAA